MCGLTTTLVFDLRLDLPFCSQIYPSARKSFAEKPTYFPRGSLFLSQNTSMFGTLSYFCSVMVGVNLEGFIALYVSVEWERNLWVCTVMPPFLFKLLLCSSCLFLILDFVFPHTSTAHCFYAVSLTLYNIRFQLLPLLLVHLWSFKREGLVFSTWPQELTV